MTWIVNHRPAAAAAVFAAVAADDSRYGNFRFTLPDVVADQLAARHQHLQAGWQIYSGSLIEPIRLTPDIAVTTEIARLGGIGSIHGEPRYKAWREAQAG